MNKSKPSPNCTRFVTLLSFGVMAVMTSRTQAQALIEAAPAKTVESDVWGGVGCLFGATTQQIGGQARVDGQTYQLNDPLSELKWPQRALMASLGGSVTLSRRFEFHGQFDFSISDFGGTTEDSDWTDPDSPDTKTIFSESDATFDGVGGDFGFRYWIIDSTSPKGKATSRFEFAPGVGVMFQRNEWTASNLDQWNPQDPSEPHILIPGEVGTYETTAILPYAEFGFRKAGQRFSFSGSLELAYAMVSDEDDHLLRYKLTESDNSGFGGKLSLRERFAITQALYVQAQADVFGFYTTGTQDQSYYDGPNEGATASIDSRIFSVQAMFTLAAGVKF